ncbi:putative glycolipid-binding domain-containing protein, partial [Acinetobacter baumannii]|uniref:putative glycolipid-binding domain-containing protein n=1 Tax=Acinetobacter baumannii TaxID=470 RepID=UPI0013D3CF54
TSLQASYNGISASGAISFIATAGAGGYSTYYEVRLAAAGLTTAIRLTVTSGGEAGFDVITKWFRLINPLTNAVSGYFD